MDITYIGVFLEGLLSFLSPCVLPLLPLYLSYLAGQDHLDDKYDIKKLFISTLFFVLGICFTFFLLAISIESIKTFITNYQNTISIVSGTLLIVFGLHELGVIHINVLDLQLKINNKLDLKKMNVLKAFIFGFIFSFGYSPCIGPLLSSALFMAASNPNGYLYIVAYGLGLVIPFLISGLLANSILKFFKEKKKIIFTLYKVAGIILICFGIYLIMNASKSNNIEVKEELTLQDIIAEHEFIDQNGNSIKLSDYKGKYVMMDFIASWCHYCVQEIPTYQEYASKNECECIYIMSPNLNSEGDLETVKKFIDSNNIQLKVLIDTDGSLVRMLGITSYPTKFVLSDEGEFKAYYSGMIADIDTYSAFLAYSKQVSED